MTASLVTYWHGGAPRIGGGYILPPSVTKAKNTLLDAAAKAGLPSPARADRVYVATAYAAALLYATYWPTKRGGWVYLVEPIGQLEADPDCDLPGLSWQCDRARILDVVRPTADEVMRVRWEVGIG